MNRIVIKNNAERIQRHALPDLDAAPESPVLQKCETSIEVLKQGGVTLGLEVRCKCGEVTVVEFEYPESTS